MKPIPASNATIEALATFFQPSQMTVAISAPPTRAVWTRNDGGEIMVMDLKTGAISITGEPTDDRAREFIEAVHRLSGYRQQHGSDTQQPE